MMSRSPKRRRTTVLNKTRQDRAGFSGPSRFKNPFLPEFSMHSRILILDFGSQVTQLIARRVREAGVFSEVVPYDVSPDFIRDYARDGSLKGVILSGGQNSVTESDTPRVPQAVFELGVPVLGICYGMQAMAAQLGGKLKTAKSGNSVMPRSGHAITPDCWRGLPIPFWMTAQIC